MDEDSLDRAAAAVREALNKGKTVEELVSLMSSAKYSKEEITAVLAKARSAKPSQRPPKYFCTKCGNGIPAGDLFCTECGAQVKLPEPQPPPVEQRMRYCPNCRDPVRESEIFCDKCGRKLRDAPPSIKPPDQKTSQKKKALALLVSLILVVAGLAAYTVFAQGVKVTAYGVVYDYSDRPLSNVLVSSDVLSTKTDADSSIKKIDLEKKVIKNLISGFGGNTKFALMAQDTCPYVAVYEESLGKIVWRPTCLDKAGELLEKKFIFRWQDKDAIFEALDEGVYASGSSMQEPLALSLSILNNSLSPSRKIIALTDGENAFDFDEYQSQLIPGVQVSTVGIFSQGKTSESTELDLLRKVASLGGGRFYHVFDYTGFYSAMETSSKGC